MITIDKIGGRVNRINMTGKGEEDMFCFSDGKMVIQKDGVFYYSDSAQFEDMDAKSDIEGLVSIHAYFMAIGNFKQISPEEAVEILSDVLAGGSK